MFNELMVDWCVERLSGKKVCDVLFDYLVEVFLVNVDDIIIEVVVVMVWLCSLLFVVVKDGLLFGVVIVLCLFVVVLKI